MENQDNCFFLHTGIPNAGVLLVLGIFTLIIMRIFYVIYLSGKPLYDTPPGPLSTLIVLGSGAQTQL